MEELCSTYNFNVREFYSACRFLEREGFISLPDAEEAYSSLYIPLSRNELYRFQVNHMALGSLIQNILRLYPGLFAEPTPIDEGRIASRSMLSAAEVAVMLTQMDGMKVLQYRPRPEKPQIIFLSARVDEREIMLADSNYDLLKQAAHSRLEAMLRYVSTDNECRSRQLLAYFGEEGADCGVCDVCRKRQKGTMATEEDVLEALNGGVRMRINDLVEQLEAHDRQEVSPVVRRMLDEGTVVLDDNLFLTLSK